MDGPRKDKAKGMPSECISTSLNSRARVRGESSKRVKGSGDVTPRTPPPPKIFKNSISVDSEISFNRGPRVQHLFESETITTKTRVSWCKPKS